MARRDTWRYSWLERDSSSGRYLRVPAVVGRLACKQPKLTGTPLPLYLKLVKELIAQFGFNCKQGPESDSGAHLTKFKAKG